MAVRTYDYATGISDLNGGKSAITGSLYAFDNTHKALLVNATSAAPYIKRELGIDYYQQRAARVGKALTAPQDFIKERNDLVEASMAKLGETYAEAYNKFIVAGYSEDIAKAQAKAITNNAWASEKIMIDLQYPESIEDKLYKANTDGEVGVKDIWKAGGLEGKKTKKYRKKGQKKLKKSTK